MRDLVVVSCSRGAKEDTELYPSLQKLQIRDFHFVENNRRGLPECYNQFIEQFAGTDRILVLAHSDLTIADVYVREKLNHAVQSFNIVGLAGSAYFDVNHPTTGYAWPIWPEQYLSGAIEHPIGDGLTSWMRLGPTPRRCIVLDGVLLALDMRTIGGVRFDPLFTFNLYDLDFCLTAYFESLALGTTNVYAQHASAGNFSSPQYRQAMHDFRSKWSGKFVEEGEA